MTLEERIEKIARSPVLLVACDYDGTIAPIVSDPSLAHPNREVIVALKQLCALADTHVTVISGRSLADLARLAGMPEDVHLVGSHGSEFDPGFARSLPESATHLHRELAQELSAIAAQDRDVILEEKPASIAFHYRNVDESLADGLIQAALEGPGSMAGVHTKRGKKVLEFSVVETSKGHALERMRTSFGATAAVYIGDDRTDEDAFAAMRGPDVSIKVGSGETLALDRVEDPTEVARLLASLAEQRSAWLTGARAVPIENHAMLSDLRTVALLTPDARVVWFCAPRIDSAALFADLIGGSTAGYFSVCPAQSEGDSKVESQEYAGDSLVLQTRWKSGLEVIDYLDASGSQPLQRAGRSDLVRVLRGRGRACIEFAPRLDFGRVSTRIQVRENGLAINDTMDPIVLHAPGVSWSLRTEGQHQTACAEVDLSEGPIVLELRYGTGNLDSARVPEIQRRRQTLSYWEHWAAGLTDSPVAPRAVRFSAVVLKGLCHGPTGAIAAAATTSLPEHLGGVRNWDYRYAWLRDGAMTAEALARLGSHSEAMSFLGWVLGVLDQGSGPDRLRPLYSVTGNFLGSEGEIAELSGYAGSRPVRIGNAAAQQVQLDVFGPIVSLVHVLVESGAPISAEHWRLVEAMVLAVERRWREPDHGIWEIRGPRRHYVHSKIMCWLAVDRAIEIARHFLGEERDSWHTLRAEIASEVLERGYNEEMGCFVTAYGSPEVDAAVLTVGLAGLVAAEDPRFRATVERVERDLRRGPTVFRYRFDDGLPGEEGGFHLCTTWLIESLVAIGEREKARELFDAYVGLAGCTGLLPEEYDTRSERGLGNHPQAYSHLGLIRAALALARGPR